MPLLMQYDGINLLLSRGCLLVGRTRPISLRGSRERCIVNRIDRIKKRESCFNDLNDIFFRLYSYETSIFHQFCG